MVISKECENKIIELYINGQTMTKISKDLSKDQQTIKRILVRNNIKLRTLSETFYLIREPDKIETEIQKEVFELYENGISINEISKRFNINPKKITNLIKNNKSIQHRTILDASRCRFKNNNIKNQVNTQAFSVLNEKSAYWLGFIATDGNITNNRLSIKLQLKDVGHLEKLKDFLNSKSKISTRINYKSKILNKHYSDCTFQFTNRESIQDCINYGITSNKSKTLKITNQELIKSRDFWRGCIDGDGSILILKNKRNKYNCYLYFYSASIEFINQFKNYCDNFLSSFILKRGKLKNNNILYGKSCKKIVFSGEKAFHLIKHFYSNSIIHLDRKQDTINEILHKFSFYAQ
mgnify:CR=1 FL=1